MVNATQIIISAFGGVSALARAIGRTPSTVQYWLDQGRIPPKNRDEVVRAFREKCAEVVDAAVDGECVQ